MGVNTAVSRKEVGNCTGTVPPLLAGSPHSKGVRHRKPFYLAQNLAAMEKCIWDCG